MTDPNAFDDPGPPIRVPPSRLGRVLRVSVLLLLIVSMTFLAWISGRGEVVVTPVVPPTAVPTSSIASRLAIVDEEGHLTTTNALGGSVVSYGGAGTRYSFPAWSPDGSRIAAIGEDADGGAVHVFTTLADGVTASDPTVVYRSTDRTPFYLYWAPDGSRLTFLTTEPDGLALRIAPADASAPATIIREGSPMYWAWADGDRMLVHSGGDGSDAFLGEIGSAGSGVEPVGADPGGFRAPALSRDGRYRAYVVPAGGAPGRVVVEQLDGAGRHEVAVFGTAALGFGPVSDELAYIAPAGAGGDTALPVGPLRLVDAASGAVRSLLAGSVVGFFWAPDGRTIAALQLEAPGDDNVATAGSDPIPAAVSPGVTLRLVFVSVESGAIRSRRAVRVADTFATQVLPYFDQYALSHRIWAPDSAAIVLPLVDDAGASGLVVIRADGSDTRRIRDGVAGFWSP